MGILDDIESELPDAPDREEKEVREVTRSERIAHLKDQIGASTFKEIQGLDHGRPHSWRHFEPGEFTRLINEAGEPALWLLRDKLDYIEAGRFAEHLEATHSFLWPLDRDELEAWADRNPDTLKWVNVWARLNHLVTWPELE